MSRMRLKVQSWNCSRAFFIDEGRAVHGENLLVRRKGHRTADYGSRALHGLHDLLGRLIDEVVVERLQFDSNFLVHMFFLF